MSTAATHTRTAHRNGRGIVGEDVRHSVGWWDAIMRDAGSMQEWCQQPSAYSGGEETSECEQMQCALAVRQGRAHGAVCGGAVLSDVPGVCCAVAERGGEVPATPRQCAQC